MSRRLYGQLFAGLMYVGNNAAFAFPEDSVLPPPETDSDLTRPTDNFESSLGAQVQVDSRDYPYYPSRGVDAKVRAMFYRSTLGGDNNYEKVDYELNSYHSLSSRTILAWRVAGGGSYGDVPFSGLQSYGLRNSLRGYPAGKYRDRHMLTGQAELRWWFKPRWGTVAFAGSGRLWGSDERNTFRNGEWLPSVGAGLRFMALPEKKITIRVDYAWGTGGNEGLYIGLMEAF